MNEEYDLLLVDLCVDLGLHPLLQVRVEADVFLPGARVREVLKQNHIIFMYRTTLTPEPYSSIYKAQSNVVCSFG